MRNNASLVYSFLLIVGDFIALLAAFTFAYILRVSLDPRPLIDQIPAITYFGLFIVLLPFWVVIFSLLGLYDPRVYENRFAEFGRLITGCFIGILFLVGYDFISNREIFPARLVPIYGLVIGILFVLLMRTLARSLRRSFFSYGKGINNVLVVGSTPINNELIDSLSQSKISGYRVIGLVSSKALNGENHQDIKRFDNFAEATQKLRAENIHSIIQTELYAQAELNNEIVTFAQANHCGYRFVPGNSELFVGRISVDLFHSIPVIAVHQTALIGWGRVVKRLFDFGVSLLAIIILSPVYILIALLILLFDNGPVFYSQKRFSRFNSKVKLYKFRSLKRAYNKLTPEEAFNKMGRPELSREYRAHADSLPNDPRVSKVGGFLRTTKLDEIPQLFSVLKGDLSLVGPRALVPYELDQHPQKNLILNVKSGLTGLAVIAGRPNMSFDERRKLDLYYVQNWSFGTDLVILIKTTWILITRRGRR